MTDKRRDNKGRVLKEGESQRKNGTYDYRYMDVNKKRRCVYAKTLTELRKKEDEIKKDLSDGINYEAGEITVSEQVRKYVNLKRNLKYNTIRSYEFALKCVRSDSFGQQTIRSVKLSDAKNWFVTLHNRGMKYNTLRNIQKVIQSAFEMAVEDNSLRKNPIKFRLTDVVPNHTPGRTALTKKQQKDYLNFVKDYARDDYYHEIIILLGTGLRVSELYGLTYSDVDFEHRCVNINRQLCRITGKTYFISLPKTKSGVRSIPMTDSVYEAFHHMINLRVAPEVEVTVDGYTGFLFLDRFGNPKVAEHLENYMHVLYFKYIDRFGETIPKVTPHVLRHTFCTNAQQAGLDIKSLQYLMGHSSISVTLDTYTHSNYESVEKAFGQIASNL